MDCVPNVLTWFRSRMARTRANVISTSASFRIRSPRHLSFGEVSVSDYVELREVVIRTAIRTAIILVQMWVTRMGRRARNNIAMIKSLAARSFFVAFVIERHDAREIRWKAGMKELAGITWRYGEQWRRDSASMGNVKPNNSNHLSDCSLIRTPEYWFVF